MSHMVSTSVTRLVDEHDKALGNLDSGLVNTAEVAYDLLETYLSLELEAPPEMSALTEAMESYADTRHLLTSHLSALKSLSLSLRQASSVSAMNPLEGLDLCQEFTAKVSALETPYNALDSRSKYAQMPDMQEYYKRLFELEHPGESFATTQGGDAMDEDLEVTGSIVSLKCPITVRPFLMQCLVNTVSFSHTID